LKVFLIYSFDPAEQALAWRLQTLAAAYDIEMYVPRRGPGLPPQTKTAISEAMKAIDRSDCVLAIIAGRADPAVQRELKYALDAHKLVIPIVHADLVHHPFLAGFDRTFEFSPGDSPGRVESEIVEFLRSHPKVSKDKQQAIGALVAVGLGLLLMSSLSEK